MAHKLVLIDGHALAYRMFYALPVASFTTKEGEPTNATYGFARTLLDLILADDPPHYLAVSFDVGRTFRDDLFPAYKGTRERMPDELQIQIERIRQLVQTFSIPVLELDGYEADDVLGTVARQAKAFHVPVHIITGDRDLLQLVDDNTRVELPPGPYQNEPRIYDPAAVQAEYGLTPRQIVDWKALEGDKSDNIPGVAGIGRKTAVQLLQQYDTLDAIYDHLDDIATRFRAKLEAGRDDAHLSQKLAAIITDAPLQLDLEACVAQAFDRQAVLELFRELEFRSLTRRLAEAEPGEADDAPHPDAPSATDVVLARTARELADLVKTLQRARLIAFDVETTGLDRLTAELVGICLAVQPPRAYYVPVGHLAHAAQSTSGQMNLFATEPQLAPGQLPLKQVLEALGPALSDPNIPKVAHNAKYDYAILQRYGLTVSPIAFDTMLGEWLTDPASKHLGLKDLARHRLGVEMHNIESLIGSGRAQITFAEVDIEPAAAYGAADADMTLRLVEPLRRELRDKGLEQLVELEMALIPVLADMEAQGVGIDADFFKQLSAELNTRMLTLEDQIHTIAGHAFNINSTQQLSDVLFKELQLPHERLRRTSSGHFSTAAGILESLQESDPTGIIQAILEYRELGKLKSTYTDALPAMINPETGRIHTSFNQTGAVTGRIASNSPNLQNIPIRTEAGRQIRRGFVARPGYVLLSADYSQVELRILAHVSQDHALLDAFRHDQDVHRTTAAAVYNVPVEKVTFEQRRFAKAVNFGLMYGMGAYRLSRDSQLTLAEAENYIKEYFARFPGVRAYLDQTKELARRQGYVETLLGRRRYFPIFRSPEGARNAQAVSQAEREAINHPIQGTAADIIKIAMVNLHRALLADYQARMLLQVHDELLLEMPADEVAAVEPLVIAIMSSAFKLDVPLKVEAATGRNWLELKG